MQKLFGYKKLTRGWQQKLVELEQAQELIWRTFSCPQRATWNKWLIKENALTGEQNEVTWCGCIIRRPTRTRIISGAGGNYLALPPDLGEFVFVHELVHLLVPNHGKVFKSFMFAYLPDWEEREQRLHSYS